MATQVVMPKLSPTMEEGQVARWLKKEGDKVSMGEPLAEIDTDKATMEMQALSSGVLRKVLVNEGESAPLGQPIAIIGEPDEDISELLKGAKAAAYPANEAVEEPTKLPESDAAPAIEHHEVEPAVVDRGAQAHGAFALGIGVDDDVGTGLGDGELDVRQRLVIDLQDLAQAADGAAPKLLAMAHAFRAWSVAHPAEFALLFGSPVPGVVELEEGCESPEHPAARVGAAFLAPFAEVWRQLAPPPVPEDPQLTKALAIHGDVLGPAGMYAFLGAWSRLYGLVALEVFGHLRWALTDVEPLFEAELEAFVRQLVS